MNELQKLIQERKALDARIAELRHAMVDCGRAQLSYDPYNSRWRVMFCPIDLNPYHDPRFREKEPGRVSVAYGKDKEKLIEEIPMVIADLHGLYANCKGITEDDEDEP